MDFTKQETQLYEYTKSIAENCYHLLSSLALLRSISEASDQIKAGNYGSFFYTVQGHIINSAILSMTKMFEDDQKSFTIHKLNRYLVYHQKYLRIRGVGFSPQSHKFEYFSLSDIFSLALDGDIKQLIDVIVERTARIIQEYQNDLHALKDIRDRQIAHADKRGIKNKTTWDKLDELAKFIVEYLTIIEHCFLATGRSIQSDSGKPSRIMLKLFRDLENLQRQEKTSDIVS